MVPMNATVKWIGGGTLALAFGLGALAFGSTMLDSPAVAEETAPLAATSAPSASEKPVGVHGALAAKTLADIERETIVATLQQQVAQLQVFVQITLELANGRQAPLDLAGREAAINEQARGTTLHDQRVAAAAAAQQRKRQRGGGHVPEPLGPPRV